MLADETGGIAVVNQNDFDKALKQIDADTSDYYVLGYYSNNPDPTKRRRIVDVKVSKNGQKLTVIARKEYVTKPLPKPSTSQNESVGSRPLVVLDCDSALSAILAAGRGQPQSPFHPWLRFAFARSTASSRYALSISAPTKSDCQAARTRRPCCRDRTNGSIASSTRARPWRRRHCSGNFDGKVAGCGRSRSRR